MALTIPNQQMVQPAVNYQNQQNIPSTPIFAWANGQEEADRFPVPANSWAFIMDRGQDVFYIKRRDAYGNAYPLEIYDFTKRIIADPNAPVGRDEFNNLMQTVTQMSQKMSQLMTELGANEEASA